MKVHIVVKGDTLWKIARQHGIPFEELKRVNAHLANPDYIVPGMKIFLPEKHQGSHGAKVPGKSPIKGPEKGKEPVRPTPPVPVKPTPPTPPVHPVHPPPVRPTPPVPVPPIPIPTPPAPIPPTPAPVPPMPMPSTPIPMPPPMPVQSPVQTFPMSPCIQPIIGIPCGWMPIYDADCFPFVHSGQIQAVPAVQAAEQQAPMPMPMPMPPPMPQMSPPMPAPQRPIFEMESEESPIFSSQGPAIQPSYNQMPDGWQLLESPNMTEMAGMADMTDMESPAMCMQSPPICSPEQGYIPQVVSPAMQGGWGPMQTGHSMMHFPAFYHFCGCGGQHPMMPMHWGHPCHCNVPMQPTPYQMMPMSNQGFHGYGAD
ncbi:LysM peptidoglycan-binding domain-containing protein [Sporosarcina limicola]|uniref:Morphogenetic protein associated with SpoVID n=1 Tax=Sporosarcina limicola TaxID=34101 RepID=A0A927MNA5_9BACL|nr:morphogenetic protein associated with SpoVID [Sporosarcina limicola]